jgi:hypothetical protein
MFRFKTSQPVCLSMNSVFSIDWVTLTNCRHQIFINLYAPCVLYIGQAFHYSPDNAFYIFNHQIYFIIWYLLDRASLI